MVKFDPNNELSDKELDALAEKDFDMFLDYLDQKTAYLKQFTKPLSSYHTKRYASMSAKLDGRDLSKEEYDKATKIGKDNEKKAAEKIVKDWKKESEEILKNNGVKNVKTNRSQWFD